MLWELEHLAREESDRLRRGGGGGGGDRCDASPTSLASDQVPSLHESACASCGTRGRMLRDDSSGWSGVCGNCGLVEQRGHLVVGCPTTTAHFDRSDDGGHSLRSGPESDGRSLVDSRLPNCTTGTRDFHRGRSSCRAAKYVRVTHDRCRMPYRERALYKVFKSIDELLDRMVRSATGQSDDSVSTAVRTVREHACALYTQLSDRRLSRGMVRKGLVAACVYRAWVDLRAPRNAKEIAAAANLPGWRLARANKQLERIIQSNASLLVAPVCGTHMIARCCDRLASQLHPTGIVDEDTWNRIRREATRVLHYLKEDELPQLCGRAPTSLVAGALLCALDKYPIRGVTKRAIALATAVSVVTANKLYHIMRKL